MYLVTILIISVFSIGVQSDNNQTITDKLQEIIEQRCNRNAPNAVQADEISQQLSNVDLATKRLRAAFARTTGNEYCLNKQHLAQPIYDFITFLQPCLLENEKSIGKLLLKQHLDEILEFFCENHLANFDKTYDFKSRDCFVKMMQHSDRFDDCFIEFIDGLDGTQTKNIWCQELDALENCTINIWQEYCPGPDYHNLHLFTQDFFDEISEPCLTYYSPLAINLEFVEKRCNNHSKTPVDLNIIEEYVEDFIDKIEEPLSNLLTDTGAFCNGKNAAVASFNNLLNLIGKCLPTDEAYFDDFATQAFNEIFHYLCGNDATNLKKIIKPEMRECFDILTNSQKFEIELQHCLNDTIYLFNDITTQDELCRELNEIEDCLDDIFVNYCAGEKFQDLREFNAGFFDVVTKPCSAAANFNNPIIILLIIVIVWAMIA